MNEYNKITALYSRLSVGDEDRDGGESNSIVNQKAFLERYAQQQRLTNIRHYIDDDESGRFFDRSAYSRMMEDVENGKIGVCIMKDLTRWGRDYLQVGNAMEVFRRNNVRFIAVNNGIDSDNPDTLEFAPFINIMSEWYAKDISKKVKTGIRTKGASGKPIATEAPYGYNALGAIPQDRYEQMSQKYSEEYYTLKAELAELKEQLSAFEDAGGWAHKFLKLIERYAAFTDLTPAILNEFISRIEVHERDKKRAKQAVQHIGIGEYDITADELLSGTGGNTETKTEQAERLILDLLADGKEMASEDIVKAAAEAGISERTVQNAKRSMGGILGARRVGSQWYNFIKKKQPPETAK